MQIAQCTKELENKARENTSLELYNLYCASAPAELNEICKNLDKYTSESDLRELSPACLTNILKKFLRELPDPIIPVQWYDKFVEASSKSPFLVYVLRITIFTLPYQTIGAISDNTANLYRLFPSLFIVHQQSACLLVAWFLYRLGQSRLNFQFRRLPRLNGAYATF